MIWLRSWPKVIPAGRRYVVDDLPRVMIEGHDLATAHEFSLPGWCQDCAPWKREQPGTGLILVEWDIAYSAGDHWAMERAATLRPAEITVAPYKLYPISTRLAGPVWAHSNGQLPGESWIPNGAHDCDHFAFGMVYLPWALVNGFLRDRHLMSDPRFTDTNFSLWHSHSVGKRVRIEWAARPVHLHW